MQPEKISEIRSWFSKAKDDLRAAEIDVAATPPLFEDASLHCRQAAEKSMKGFLTVHDQVFRKTHDLDELATACEAIDKTLCKMLEPARDLTPYAWAFRYPGETAEVSADDVDQAIRIAQQVYDALLSRLPVKIQP